MRIYLTGFMGAGKSAVGRRLAELLGTAFVDLDREIERRAGLTVAAIFETRGEEGFRRLEAEALGATLELGGAVVATGGGAPLAAANRRLMRSAGVRVWLKPPFALLARRLAGSERRRPLFRDVEQAESFYRSRLPAYRECEVVVEVGEADSADEVADRVRRLLEGAPCAT